MSSPFAGAVGPDGPLPRVKKPLCLVSRSGGLKAEKAEKLKLKAMKLWPWLGWLADHAHAGRVQAAGFL
jgi:hypothetical protein